MPVLNNIKYLATCRDEGNQKDIHPIREAAVVWKESEIVWVGKEQELPDKFADEEKHDAGNKMVVPGLIDCHTHLAFGGWRSDEYNMRLKGKSYRNIARAGGGILSTVRATRNTSEGELFDKAAAFLKQMTALGVTTVECKSGYGLNTEEELKILRVYKRLSEEQPVHIIPTFLGAHTIPAEFKNNRNDYINLIIDEMIPAVAEEGLADFCDIFVEDSAFSVNEAREILINARVAGLTPKLHADQLTCNGGAELAAELEAASADHLEKISERGIRALAKAGVIGVTLPLASLYIRQDPLNCRKLVDASVKVAVATDFNPGSAPSYDLPLAMMLACNMGNLTPAEALKGVTIYAARALGRDFSIGSIEAGKSADFGIIDVPDPDFWMYHYRPNCCESTYIKGKKIV